jgi:hypothetical protein
LTRNAGGDEVTFPPEVIIALIGVGSGAWWWLRHRRRTRLAQFPERLGEGRHLDGRA